MSWAWSHRLGCRIQKATTSTRAAPTDRRNEARPRRRHRARCARPRRAQPRSPTARGHHSSTATRPLHPLHILRQPPPRELLEVVPIAQAVQLWPVGMYRRSGELLLLHEHLYAEWAQGGWSGGVWRLLGEADGVHSAPRGRSRRRELLCLYHDASSFTPPCRYVGMPCDARRTDILCQALIGRTSGSWIKVGRVAVEVESVARGTWWALLPRTHTT